MAVPDMALSHLLDSRDSGGPLGLFVGVVFWAATLTLAFGLARRAALWRTGAAARVDWWGLLAIPKRYFVDLHHVVAREPFIARTHVAVAGGATLALVTVALNYGLALHQPWLDAALLVGGLVMLGGAAAVAWRRRDRAALPRLSRGPWQRLPVSLLVFAAALIGLGAATVSGISVAPWFAALIALALAAGAAEMTLGIGLGGPMKHAVAGPAAPRLASASGALRRPLRRCGSRRRL